ncbi:hypothetical protein [Streptomyces atratus]|uniref:Transposase (putative) YhgA-like domain-containing protein n=1 Tax=Streptomyces atratus TaxID=1893 RepID=A0A2Z5JGH0_STRAR|nr:hypothetical protein [Streptomyces atratus]AXE79450.1 hypothetical protein C5746_23895 [Streptomyces atratus]
MVSSSHEAMHRIFQEYPGLFSRVSEVLGVEIGPPASATVMPTDLTENRPLERRVDTLLRIDMEDDRSYLLAIEAQGKKDPDKPASWMYYLSYLQAKYKLPPMLLVVCQDRATAEWAARPFPVGHPQSPVLTLQALVAGPHNMPVITDVAEARKDLALATLAAITHAGDPDIGAILKTLSTALRDVPETIADPIVELTAQGLGNRPAAQQWRNLVAVDLSFYKSSLSEEIRDEGRAEGRTEGRAEGIARGILLLLAQAGVDVPEEARERVMGCADLDTLSRWLLRAPTATSVEDVFAVG